MHVRTVGGSSVGHGCCDNSVRRREAIVIATHIYTPDEVTRREDELREIKRQEDIIVDQV